MAKYNAGLETKNRILEKSKELFYDIGYNELAFKDLCREANVNQGSIVYHFGGKLQIAQQIYAEMMDSMQEQMQELFAEEDELVVVIMCVFLYFDLFYKDSNLRRFCVQIAHVNMDSVLQDQYKNYSPVLHKYLSKTYSPDQMGMIIASTTGADVALQQYLSQNIDRMSFDDTIYEICKCLFYFIPTSVLMPATETARKCYQKVSVYNSRFQVTLNTDV